MCAAQLGGEQLIIWIDLPVPVRTQLLPGSGALSLQSGKLPLVLFLGLGAALLELGPECGVALDALLLQPADVSLTCREVALQQSLLLRRQLRRHRASELFDVLDRAPEPLV